MPMCRAGTIWTRYPSSSSRAVWTWLSAAARSSSRPNRGDGKTLIDELKAKDYRVVYDLQEADAVDRGRIVGLFSEEYMPTVLNGRDENYLCDATKKALEILTNNAGRKGGFLLMVEGSQIDSEALPTTLRAFWPKRATSIGPSVRRWTMPTRIRARWSS